MNIAAMIVGILGGIAGLGVSDFASGMGAFFGQKMAFGGPFLYAMPIMSIIGGGLAFRQPGRGGLLMLVSSIGWIGFGLGSGLKIDTCLSG